MARTPNYKMPAQLFHADRTTDAERNLKALVRTRLTADSTYRTHINVKEGELFIAMPRPLTTAMARVQLTEQAIADLWNPMPGVMRWNYITQSIREDMLATNEMEGVRSTRREMAQAVEAAEDQRHTRFSEFARLYLSLTGTDAHMPTTLEEIRAIYDQATDGEIADADKPDGKLFRTKDVDITTGTRILHSGTHGEEHIERLLERMLALAASEEMPPLLSALAAHYLFEYVHPFYDGNGRTGRYLLALSLRQVLTLPTLLSLSQTIAAHKDRYYKAFSVSQDPLNNGELTYFIATMLELIATGQEHLVKDLESRNESMARLRHLCDGTSERFGLSEGASATLWALLQERQFDTRPSVTINDLVRLLDRSWQSVRGYIDELERHDLVHFDSHKPIRVSAAEQLTD
ncbi:MAG: Fic family protein [Bifidobacterium sp.]|nr:Fic family protein [Bifidobacterium sp.]